MTEQNVLETVRSYYYGTLGGWSATQLRPEQYEDKDLGIAFILRHLRWMCKEILDRRVAGDKAHRWLGYIQGELRAAGLHSISDLKEHSRPKD